MNNSVFSTTARRTAAAMLMISALGATEAAAQRVVKGVVTDESGTPLVGATVRIKGSGHGAVTDINGQYGITVNSDQAVLLFSYLGMENHQVLAKGTSINVTLHPSSNQLAEVAVVSTGYQKISRERSTASYGFIDSLALNRHMHTSLVNALEGQVAGLQMDINPNTGEKSPILRGIGTFSSDVGTTPLIVIDDMPTNLTLDQINQYNVESITVLKDAAAASIYGAQAANGVIVITTKQAKTGKVNVSVNADWFISSKPNFDNLSLASSSDIIDYQTRAWQAGVESSGSGEQFLAQYKSNYYNPLFNLYLNNELGNVTDAEVAETVNQWRGNDFYNAYRDNAWRTAVTQRYNVSLSQKAGKSNFFGTINYEHDNNRTVGDKNNKVALYLKDKFELNKWFSLTMGADLQFDKSTAANGSYTSYDLQQRYERMYNDDGTRYVSPYANVSGYSGGSYNGQVAAQYEDNEAFKSFGFNVLDALRESKTVSRNVRVRPFVNAEARFLKMFKYNMMYQYEWAQRKSEQYDAEDSYIMRMTHNAMVDENGKALLPAGGRFYQQEQNTHRYTFRNQISFSHDWAQKHSVTALTGLEFRQTQTPAAITQMLYGYDPVTLQSDRMDWETLNSGAGTGMISGENIKLNGPATKLQDVRHRYASFYANASYTYNYLYSISGSIRWDEADLFGLDIKEQHKPLWSIGAGWNISGEKFMQDVSWVDYLKLRATYGVNGNVDQTSTTFFVVSQKSNSNPVRTTYLNYDDSDLPNPKLRWEKTATTNIGVDFRLFNNLINGSIEYYNRYSSDLLVRRFMDATLGTKSQVVNNGEMRNRGVELSLTGNIIRKKDWGLTATLNFAHNSNKMMKVDHSDSETATSFITSPSNYFIEGTSYNTLWAYRIDRIENGYAIAVDKDGNDLVTFNDDGTVSDIATSIKGTDDLVNMGSLTPKYNGSLSLSLRWKDFDLSTLFVFQGGNVLRLTTPSLSDQLGNETYSGINELWSAANASGVRTYLDMNTSARAYASYFDAWNRYGDNNVRKADYLKMRSLTLGYTLPEHISRAARLGRTRLTLQVSNLFTWCAAGHDIDPEAYGYNTGSRSLSQPKTVAIGLTTSF